MKHAHTVQHTVAYPGPSFEALGKKWRLSFNDQDAKGQLEELIRAHVVREEIKTKRALGGDEGDRYWREEVKPLLDSGYYAMFSPGWVSIMKSQAGVGMFLQSLLMKHHPEATLDTAIELFLGEPEQVIAAVEVIAPDFFAAVAVQMGHNRAEALAAAPVLAQAVRDVFASLRPAEPVTV